MPGKVHQEDERGECIAMVLGGMSMGEVARLKGIDKSVISRWVSAHNRVAVQQYAPRLRRARDPIHIENEIYDSLLAIFAALRAQLQVTTEQRWLEKQSAGDLALLLGTELDRTVRLLAGFRPVESAGNAAGVVLEMEAPAAPGPAEE